MKQVVVIWDKTGYKNLFKAPYESQGFLCFYCIGKHGSFIKTSHLLIDTSVLVAHHFFLLLEKNCIYWVEQRKGLHPVYVVYTNAQFSSLPGDNGVWGGVFWNFTVFLQLHKYLGQ